MACSQEPPPPASEHSRPAKMFTVEEPGANLIRSFFGEVSASDEAQLAFRVSGELVELPGTRGKQVKQGDLLAKLDPRDFQAAVNQASAQARLAQTQFDRAAELIDRQLVSQAEYDQREARAKVTANDLVRAENNLSYTEIFAPFNGVIAQQLIENYESVAAGQVTLILQTGERIDIIVDVPESIIARVQRRPPEESRRGVKVRFDSVGTDVYDAEYKEHEATADPATLTYKVTFSLPVPMGINILPGMTATVIADLSGLYSESRQGFLLPVEAVFSAEDEPADSGGKYIWKVDPDTMRTVRQKVRVGALTGTSIIVYEGVDTGDRVIAAGVHSVLPDMLVRPMERERGL